jgi:plasmid stabilization system protein ParE
MARRPAAAVDEEAELRALSERAEQSRRAVSETAGALAQTIAASASPRRLVRKGAAHVAAPLTGRISRPWLVAVPIAVVLVTSVAVFYLLRRRSGRSAA